MRCLVYEQTSSVLYSRVQAGGRRVSDQNGYSVTEACQALGGGPTALRRWIKQVEREQNGVVLSGSQALTPEQLQIPELQKRIQRLEMEKEILKKLPRS
ncbi:transposase [Pokkaliibacter sp. MBI-7]|uniref:transposase n=1 Tax=Pokkaliibacter sp. MBI-7 TaxID=3040600 RepID=UPI002446AB48|nr:transposase [Pokkaliibacter sp. MBI-7]MDH2432844.1 transposase [Pokkaliibacter sp. MBI-7]